MKNKNKVMREGICLAALAAAALIVGASPTWAAAAPAMMPAFALSKKVVDADNDENRAPKGIMNRTGPNTWGGAF